MSVSLYMDVHVPGPVTRGLLLRGVDVLPAQADDAARLPDPELLQRATDLGRVLYTQDRDFLEIGPDWQRSGKNFAGILFSEQLAMSFGELIEELTVIGLAGEPEDCANLAQFLPL